ncbi:MarR family transcriptional regulator [Leucothrix sargassi]|nr:MarR family transcriptional regulator [Leucothrix sargassi]
MDYPQLKLDKQICHRLYMASNRIIRSYREPLEALGLTYPQYIVMMALWEKDGITIAELLEKTAIDGGAMTQILKKMTDKSLLSIVKSEEDKRKRFIKLETHGRELRHQAAGIPAQIQCSFSDISEQEAQQLIMLLDKINR